MRLQQAEVNFTLKLGAALASEAERQGLIVQPIARANKSMLGIANDEEFLLVFLLTSGHISCFTGEMPILRKEGDYFRAETAISGAGLDFIYTSVNRDLIGACEHQEFMQIFDTVSGGGLSQFLTSAIQQTRDRDDRIVNRWGLHP